MLVEQRWASVAAPDLGPALQRRFSCGDRTSDPARGGAGADAGNGSCTEVVLAGRGAPWTAGDWHEVRGLLPAEQWLRLTALRRPEDRQDSAVGWLLLTRLVGVRGAQLGRDGTGRPYASAGVGVSLAHAGGWIVAAVHRGGRVGVDVEVDRPVSYSLARRCLSAAELVRCSRAPAIRSDVAAARSDVAAACSDGAQSGVRSAAALEEPVDGERFLRLWTAKEAYLKAIGTGLAVDPRTVEVDLDGPGVRLVGDAWGDWSLRSVPAGRGIVATVCVERHR